MKKYLPHLILTVIVILAFAVRFYKLGSVPSGLYVDEAAQGYSAYSILKTGKDEFGMRLPIVFRSMTDFRTPVYTYIVSAIIPIFGVNSFSVRFPSFIFGVLSVISVYFLTLQISSNKKLSLITSFLIAVSPWHILFSRTAYESNVSLFFLITGILFLIKSLKKPYFLIISAILLAISVVSYQSERIVVPIILAVYFLRLRKTFLDKKHSKTLFAGLLIGIIILLPTLSIVFTPGFWARASGLNIFSHAKQLPDGFIQNYRGIFSILVNGSWFLSTREFLWHYFSYFSPRYMFLLGDSDLHISYPEISTFFIWQLPFYIYGLWLLFKEKLSYELKFFIISFFLICPIPAAVTRDPYTTLRSLPLLIPQLMVISLGIEKIYGFIKNKKLIFLYSGGIILITIYSLAKLYSSAFVLDDFYRAKYWYWGWDKVAGVINGVNTQNPVVIDNSRSDPELILAFFLKYDPARYQSDNFDVPLKEYYINLFRNRERHIGNIITRSINWEKDLMVDQYLVGDELAISPQQIKIHNLTLITEIKYPDGTVAFRIVRTNPIWEKLQRTDKTQALPKGTG